MHRSGLRLMQKIQLRQAFKEKRMFLVLDSVLQACLVVQPSSNHPLLQISVSVFGVITHQNIWENRGGKF